MIAVISIYFFIFIGFIAKKRFSEIDEKSFVIVSVYFLQPFLTIWGLTLKKIDFSIVEVPLFYLLIIFLALPFTYLLSKFSAKEDRGIATITALIGNTGNLGIPLSYALWGEMGAFYATILNLTNLFFVYLFGIFFYANRFDLETTKKILKIPIIYVALIAILINYMEIDLSPISQMLEMGAYSSMVIQLIIFGIYTAHIKIKRIDIKLSLIVSLEKFILLPLLGYLILNLIGVDEKIAKIIILELSVPIAVNNVNLAALFNNKPEVVAWLIILTSFLYLFIFPIYFLL